MTEKDILGRIDEMVAEEHELRSRRHRLDEAERSRLRELEVGLDQCWDLLRQRRARAEFGEDPEQAEIRPVEEVESYRQ